MPKEQYAGAEIVLKVLQDQDVDVVFGYPGGVTLPLMTFSTSRTGCATSCPATSRRRCMRRRAMRAAPARWASSW